MHTTGMIKPPSRTVTFSLELDGVLGVLASGHQQDLSEYLEIQLRKVPEIRDTIQLLRDTPEPKSMMKGNMPVPVQMPGREAPKKTA